jgi:hypothetical protein
MEHDCSRCILYETVYLQSCAAICRVRSDQERIKYEMMDVQFSSPKTYEERLCFMFCTRKLIDGKVVTNDKNWAGSKLPLVHHVELIFNSVFSEFDASATKSGTFQSHFHAAISLFTVDVIAAQLIQYTTGKPN